MTIGKRIQRARKKAGYTQKELAELCEVATGTIQQYELDKRQPRIEQLHKISIMLGVDLDELVSDKTEIAEYANIGHTTGMEVFKAFISDGIFPYSEDKKAEFLHQIDSAIENGIEITDREKYYYDLEVEFSHKILDDLLEPYKNADITDIAELVGYFLRLNDRGQTKVLEYEDDLFENKYYKAD